MDVIDKAIMDKYKAVDEFGSHNSLFTALTGEMHNTVAPQGTRYPYCVFGYESGPTEFTFTEELEESEVVFELYDGYDEKTGAIKSVVTINSLYNYLNAVYHEQPLTISGYTTLWMYRTEKRRGWSDKAEEWLYQVVFSLYTEKSR